MPDYLEVVAKYLVIAQVIAVIAKCAFAEKIAPKQSDFRKYAVISRKSANQLQYYCYPLAVVLRIIHSTAAKPPQ